MFAATHALQCGFCTPGFLIAMVAFLTETPELDEAAVLEGLPGNLCRCTNIVDIVLLAARRMAGMR